MSRCQTIANLENKLKMEARLSSMQQQAYDEYLLHHEIYKTSALGTVKPPRMRRIDDSIYGAEPKDWHKHYKHMHSSALHREKNEFENKVKNINDRYPLEKFDHKTREEQYKMLPYISKSRNVLYNSANTLPGRIDT